MKTWKRVLGKERPSTLTSMANLASTYRNKGRWSTWHTPESGYNLKDNTLHCQLLFNIQRCTFTDDSIFADWLGIQDEPEILSAGNYRAILAFAWAYILSACWMEMQQVD